jgi:acetyltransferase-like isoleucine patch superfamily enzyme
MVLGTSAAASRADSSLARVRVKAASLAGEAIRWADAQRRLYGAIGPQSPTARRFSAFGEGSIVCFPAAALLNEHAIELGAHTMIGPNVTLSAGWGPGHPGLASDVVKIGDRCLIGRGSSIVGHRHIHIGNDVWTGHAVYITDMNHGYEDVTKPLSVQNQAERPVNIGDGSWLGHGVVVLPGVTIGRNVAVGANSVVTRDLPDFCVAAGVPARVIRQYDPESGWRTPTTKPPGRQMKGDK